MSRRRAALLERFRSRARDRVRLLVGALARGTEEALDAEAWNEHLGALHTMKGESRMLGLVALAMAVHGLEDALHGTTAATLARADQAPLRARLDAALASIDAMLAQELVDDDAARALGAQVLEALGVAPSGRDGPEGEGDSDGELAGEAGEARAAAATQPDSLDRGHAPRPERAFVEATELAVSRPEVDGLCEGLETLRAAVARCRSSGSADATTLAELLARTERLADDAWALRIGPVEPMLAAMAIHAEELAERLGKPLRVVVDAEGAALDRPVLEALAEPLLHLIRNAVDHGLESPSARLGKPATATLRLEAVTRGADVALVIADDGGGIDPDAIRQAAVARGLVDRAAASIMSDEDALDLLFRAGFSTKTQATELSGRGLGLDVVRRVAESLGGDVSVASTRGRGTRFVVTVPAFLARERVLVVPVGHVSFGISARLVHVIERTVGRVERGASGAALRSGDALVPLCSLAELMGFPPAAAEPLALVVDVAERRWALSVASIEGERDLLRRPADRGLAAFGIASASAVLDDGRLVLFPVLAERLRSRGAHGTRLLERGREPQAAPLAVAAAKRALVVDDSPIVRELVSELLAAASFVVTSAGDGRAALDLLERESFDVVVSDLEMPRLDGLELLRLIRARGLETPVVMVTTRGSAEDRRRADELGANGYVVKTDFHEGDLIEVVRRVSGGRR